MENLPLGHNHPAFLKSMWGKDWDKFLINDNLTADNIATADFSKKVRDTLLPLAPNDLKSITLIEGRHAAEFAVYEAMAERGRNHKFTCLGFKGTHHGNSLVLTQFAHP